MLPQLKKLVGGVESSAEAMALQTELTAALSANTELTANLENLSAALAAKDSALAELTASLESVNAALSAANEKLAQVEKDQAELINTQRKTRLTSLIGEVRAEAAFSAIAGLDDKSFDAVLSAMTASAEAEAQSFQEHGVDAQETPETTSREHQLLAKKYGN